MASNYWHLFATFVKQPQYDLRAIKKCIIFHLFIDNRTYHFQAEDENEQRAWTSVLVNCKEGALMRAFHQQAGESNDSGHSLLDLQRSIIRAVRAMPGNQVCADCGSTNGMFYSVMIIIKYLV